MNHTFFQTLSDGIKHSFAEYAEFPFLEIGDDSFSYAEIGGECVRLANCISETGADSERFVGVFGYKSKTAYVGIYGVLTAGKAYVPLNPRFPGERLSKIIALGELKTIILAEECVRSFNEFANEIESLKVICYLPDETVKKLAADFPHHEFVSIENWHGANVFPQIRVSPPHYAYLLFTSGSTGIPKGVAVTHANVCAYANYQIEHYGVSTADKMSQMPDLTFDLSIHDLFVSVLSGACLCVVPEKQMIAPGKFIREKEITFWTSVPSVVIFLEKFGMLKPNAFPTVRHTMFCGEALPAKSAELWQNAAPKSLVENTYGPTETTVAITNHVWNSKSSLAECRSGIVALGKIFPTQKVKLLNEEGKAVGENEVGEIYLGGSQVAPGYFNDAEVTAEKFVKFNDDSEVIWYKTGDLAQQDENGVLFYIGRIDEQVKIRGYRVELQEIDRVLREFAETDSAISVVKKSKTGNSSAIVCFIQGETNESLKAKIFQGFRRSLPEYMIPSEIVFIIEMPLNQNGKIDRKMLLSCF